MASPKPMWTYYTATIRMRDKLIGGWPKNADVEEALLRARGLEDLIPAVIIPEGVEAQEELKQQKIEKSWIGFKIHDGVPILEARNLKAMLN